MEYKFMHKNEFALLLGVSPRTLSSWLNNRYFEKLEGTGYVKNQKLLTPKQVKILREILVITEEQ